MNNFSSFKNKLFPEVKMDELLNVIKAWASTAQEDQGPLDPSDLVMLLLLAELQILGFRWTLASPSSSQPPVSTDPCQTQLPMDWRNGSKDSGKSDRFYTAHLKHDQSQFHFVIKGLVMGDQLVVHGLAEEVEYSTTDVWG
jgi:hypothetical protein